MVAPPEQQQGKKEKKRNFVAYSLTLLRTAVLIRRSLFLPNLTRKQPAITVARCSGCLLPAYTELGVYGRPRCKKRQEQANDLRPLFRLSHYRYNSPNAHLEHRRALRRQCLLLRSLKTSHLRHQRSTLPQSCRHEIFTIRHCPPNSETPIPISSERFMVKLFIS